MAMWAFRPVPGGHECTSVLMTCLVPLPRIPKGPVMGTRPRPGGQRHGHGVWRGQNPGFARHSGHKRAHGRGRRGFVREAILALLAEEQLNGYQIIQSMEERTSGRWKPSAGSVYPALNLLADEGLIEPTDSEERPQWQLTDAGRAYVAEHSDDLKEPWRRAGGEADRVLDIRSEISQLRLALQQLSLVGTTEQKEQGKTVMADARRAIYRILAADDQ